MSGPLDFGRGRNGPAVPMLGQGNARPVAAPYRVDMAEVMFGGLGDVVVVTLAPPDQQTQGGIVLAPHQSPYHVVMSAGPLVSDILGVMLEPGDRIVIEGGHRISTTAGDVWLVRAKSVLAVVTPIEGRDVSPTEPPDGPETDPEPRAA